MANQSQVPQCQRWMPLISYDNRQGGNLTSTALMLEGGIIARDAPRHPLPVMHPGIRGGLPETARRLDPPCPACPALGKVKTPWH
jgi:hypothetical protein